MNEIMFIFDFYAKKCYKHKLTDKEKEELGSPKYTFHLREYFEKVICPRYKLSPFCTTFAVTEDDNIYEL